MTLFSGSSESQQVTVPESDGPNVLLSDLPEKFPIEEVLAAKELSLEPSCSGGANSITPETAKLKTVIYLLKQKPIPEVLLNAFCTANWQSNEKIIEALMKYAKDNTIKLEQRGIQGLVTSIHQNHVNNVKTILANSNGVLYLNSTVDNLDQTPFHHACLSANKAIVELFLNYSKSLEIDLKKKKINNETGFQFVCESEKTESFEVLNLLLSRAKEFNLDINNKSPHRKYTYKGGLEVYHRSGFHMACKSIRKVEIFIQNIKKFELKVDATGPNGDCKPLRDAIRWKDYQLAEILLKNASLLGINLKATDSKGFTYEDTAGRDPNMKALVQSIMFAAIAKRQKV